MNKNNIYLWKKQRCSVDCYYLIIVEKYKYHFFKIKVETFYDIFLEIDDIYYIIGKNKQEIIKKINGKNNEKIN